MRLYGLLQVKIKLNKQSALLQSVKSDSINVDECICLNYETGREN